MGELHLEVLVDRMRREFKVEANVGKPQVAYRETITKAVTKIDYTHKKQTGGSGQFARVIIDIAPSVGAEGASDVGYLFENKVTGGRVPREYIPSVDAGCREAMENGVLAGYPMVDLKVTLTDGAYHDVDSSELAFKIAGSMAFKDAARKAGPVLLEPMMGVEVTTPEDYMGDVIGDLNSRRGQIQAMEERSGARVVKALVPLSGRSNLFVRLTVVPNTGESANSSQGLSVTPITPPQISTQPASVEIRNGGTATLSVKVNSTAPRSYQWYRGNRGDISNPVGTNASTLATPPTNADTLYWVRVSNAAGYVDSAAALVKIATAPVITAQPASVTISSGQTATLSVTATGSTTLLYRWYQGPVGVTTTPVGSNSASFTTPPLTKTTSYWVKVENWISGTSSSTAVVTVAKL
jgi:hypothetical protein